MYYLIKQRSLYWKGSNFGYSQHLGDAGIYDEKKAKGIEKNNREPPDVLVPIDINIKEDIEEELAQCHFRIHNLTKMLKLIED